MVNIGEFNMRVEKEFFDGTGRDIWSIAAQLPDYDRLEFDSILYYPEDNILMVAGTSFSVKQEELESYILAYKNGSRANFGVLYTDINKEVRKSIKQDEKQDEAFINWLGK